MNYKLSILVPTYNRLDLFKETLSSILKQVDNEPVEIVIVDDGSTERNYEYALEISKKYPFVEVQRHEKNLGVGQARNTLLSLAKGEYLVFIDSDDLLMDGALKKMLRTYLELAKIAYKSGLYDKARVYLHKSIESYPEFRRSFKYFKLQTKIYFKKVFCHSQ